ncbi:MAG: flavodoxin [Deltaproteobacteria bacterium HGW-Deltaproteobacteria-6]|nr:MAG: flavodoxin [Deltaproteobacteria bacterium HGW-Deltaproteobacteria-6]
MPYTGCLVCHVAGEGKAGTLKGKVPGSHLHALKGVQCAQCHGKVKKPAPVEMAKCLACHGATAKLAEKTAKVKPSNPHESPHYGTDADCNLCHHQHARSENLCAQCHKFDFIVP